MEKHERLKFMRKNAGYRHGTAAAAAMQAVVSTYLGHENGSRTLNDSDASKYAEFFDGDLAWLLTGKGNAPTKAAQPAAITSRSIEVAGRCRITEKGISVHLGESDYVVDSAEITLIGRITHVVSVL